MSQTRVRCAAIVQARRQRFKFRRQHDTARLLRAHGQLAAFASTRDTRWSSVEHTSVSMVHSRAWPVSAALRPRRGVRDRGFETVEGVRPRLSPVRIALEQMSRERRPMCYLPRGLARSAVGRAPRDRHWPWMEKGLMCVVRPAWRTRSFGSGNVPWLPCVVAAGLSRPLQRPSLQALHEWRSRAPCTRCTRAGTRARVGAKIEFSLLPDGHVFRRVGDPRGFVYAAPPRDIGAPWRARPRESHHEPV